MIDVVLCAVLVLQSGAQPQPRNDTRLWYQLYADAQQKIQKQDWAGAFADIELASRRGAPKPGRSVLFYGDYYAPFNPDYYSGVALLNLKRYDEADRAFERVKQAQLIRPSDSLSKDFVSQSSTAKDLLAKSVAPPAVAAATTPPPVVPSTGLPPPAASVVASQAPPVGPPSAPTPDPSQSGSVSRGQQSANQAPPPDPKVQQPIARPPQAAVRPPVNQGGYVTPTQQSTRPPAAPAPLPPTAPVGDERSALVDFFSGQYDQARNKLEKLVATGYASPRARLYLASSLVALGLSGGADRVASVAQARTQLALAGSAALPAVDLSLISPRIRSELGLAP